MNKIITTASFVALGAASLSAAYAPGLSSMEASKPWSVSASLRGFYDDNYTTTGASPQRDSFGFEVSPSASLNLPLDQTYIGLSYTYALRYYQDRADLGLSSADHSHQFKATLDHAFSERYKLALSDSFVIAQEPQLIDPTIITTPTRRVEGDNIRNLASATFTGQLSPLLSTVVSYNNTLYDYDQEGSGSRSALLDRMEHMAILNLRWQALPQTVGVVGYQFQAVDNSSENSLDPATPIPNIPPSVVNPFLSPTLRDRYSHFFYVGADQNFSSQLNGSARVGIEYTDYHRLDKSEWSPYADLSLTYLYNPGSYFQVGFRHTRNQTDVAAGSATDLVVDQESSVLYAAVTHKITAKLTGNLTGQYQNSTFEGGKTAGVDGKAENVYLLGLNLVYRFNEHISAETGYNYDRLDSDLATGGRSFDRNRLYIGVRATY